MESRAASSTLRIMPPSYATPTTLESRLLVTLWVMSTRCGSPHSATRTPLWMMTPVSSPRSLIGPMASPNGSRPKAPVVVELEVARVLDLIRDGEVDRIFQQLRVDACVRRRLALPVGPRERLRLRRKWQRHQRANHNSPEPDLRRALLP